MQETTISKQLFNQLDEQAKQEGTTPEAVLDSALAEFLKGQ